MQANASISSPYFKRITLEERISSNTSSVLEKVKSWAKTAGKILLGTLALYINPTFFFGGLLLATLTPDNVSFLQERLDLVGEKMDLLKGVALVAIAIIAHHVTVTASAFYAGSLFGSYLIN